MKILSVYTICLYFVEIHFYYVALLKFVFPKEETINHCFQIYSFTQGNPLTSQVLPINFNFKNPMD